MGDEIRIAGNVIPGPDGRQWGMLVLASGGMSVQIPMSPEACESMVTEIPRIVTQTRDLVKEANTGIQVVQKMPELNPLGNGIPFEWKPPT